MRHPVDVTSSVVSGPSTPTWARISSVKTDGAADSAIDYLLDTSEMSIPA